MTLQEPLRLVILISGNGSNLQAIMDAIAKRELHAHILAVISNCADAHGLQRAAKAGITTHTLPHNAFGSRDDFDHALQTLIDDYQPQWICLAGFMRRLGAAFVNHYANRILNIHPSLLPKYPGLDTHAKAIAAGDVVHGATIHLVTEMLDAGPILAQSQLRIHADDTPTTLKKRVQQLEHQLYPQTLKKLQQGTLP